MTTHLIESQGFIATDPHPKLTEIYKNPSREKYPKRVSVRSSSELSIVTTTAANPTRKLNQQRPNVGPSIFYGADTTSSASKRSQTQGHATAGKPETHRVVKPRQRHTFNSSPKTPCFIHAPTTTGRKGQETLRAKNYCLGTKSEGSAEACGRKANPIKDSREELADFCKLEKLAKILAEDQVYRGRDGGTRKQQIVIPPDVNIAAQTIQPGKDEKSFSEQLPLGRGSRLEVLEQRVLDLENLKTICELEVLTLREDLNKSKKIIAEQNLLLENVNPQQDPSWLQPSDESVFKPYIDYFSFRTFDNTRFASPGKLYQVRPIAPHSGNVDETKEKSGTAEAPKILLPGVRHFSAPSAKKTYVGIHQRHQKFLSRPPKRVSFSKPTSKRSSPENSVLKPTDSFSKARSVPLNSKLCSKKTTILKTANPKDSKGLVGENPKANVEYLAIALASREGLVREIAHSVKKAKKILHFRFNMLLSSDFKAEDLHFLLTSHRRFLRWLNNYIHYSNGLMSKFDEKYMRSQSFFVPAVLEELGVRMKGIFIPVPGCPDDVPTLEFADRATHVTSCLLPNFLVEQQVQTEGAAVSTLDASIQTPVKPKKRLLENSTQTVPPGRWDRSVQSIPMLLKDKLIQTLSPEASVKDEAAQTLVLTISKSARSTQTPPTSIKTVSSTQTPPTSLKAASCTQTPQPAFKVSRETQFGFKRETKDFGGNTFQEFFQKFSMSSSSQEVQVSFEEIVREADAKDESKDLTLLGAPAAFNSSTLTSRSSQNVALQNFELIPKESYIILEEIIPKLSQILKNPSSSHPKSRSNPLTKSLTFSEVTESPSQRQKPLKATSKTCAANFQTDKNSEAVPNPNSSKMNQLPDPLVPVQDEGSRNPEFSPSEGFQDFDLPVEEELEEADLKVYRPMSSETGFEDCCNFPKVHLTDDLVIPDEVLLSPLKYLTEFQSETAELFYNHRGNAHLRALDEERLLFPVIQVEEDLEQNYYSQLRPKTTSPGATVEEMTCFFEETVAKFKKRRRSEPNSQEALPQYKSTAEVVIDILNQGRQELVFTSSSEDEELFSDQEDSDPEDEDYEAMFESALRETPNVEVEFERIYNAEHPFPSVTPQEVVSKPEQTLAKDSFEIPSAILEQLTTDPEQAPTLNCTVPERMESPEPVQEEYTNIIREPTTSPTFQHANQEPSDPENKMPIAATPTPKREGTFTYTNNNTPTPRTSRLPVPVQNSPHQQTLKRHHQSAQDSVKGILEESIPVELKYRPIQSRNGSRTPRRSLIPVIAKVGKAGTESSSPRNCPALSQVGVKRIERMHTVQAVKDDEAEEIPEKITNEPGHSLEKNKDIVLKKRETTGFVKKMVEIQENSKLKSSVQGHEGCHKKKSFSRLFNCKKAKTSSRI